ncbi:unnamed protein product, partial [Rotaria sp. Silwood2]
MEWKRNAITGRVAAGGNGAGNNSNQLNFPYDVIIDKKTDSFMISNSGNRTVVRWPRQNDQHAETIISNVQSFGLSMDDDGFLYIVDYEKHEVRRYRVGESEGTVVAGGTGSGERLDQLSCPRHVLVDGDCSLYVSDEGNRRVMKWMKGAEQGIFVAGEQGPRNPFASSLTPCSIFVDHLGTVYVMIV